MQANNFGNAGQNLFIGNVPLKAPKSCWWVVVTGGASTLKAHTGERLKQYTLNVFYRNTSSEDVDEKMQAFEEFINSKPCKSLAHYEVIEIDATLFQSDRDIDDEDRTVGVVEVSIIVHQS